MFMVGIFFIAINGHVQEHSSPTILLEKAKQEIYGLNFEKAYDLLAEINRNHPDFSSREKVVVLKNIISLGQTFSNLRLYLAYKKGGSLHQKGKTKKDSLSPRVIFDSHQSEYLKRTAKWAKRLDSDMKESIKIAGKIELSLKYPGSEELPSFIRKGIDTIENIKEGILPTPSQAQNIEKQEEYNGVLSTIYLCMKKEPKLPKKTFSIKGKVTLKILIYYSDLWLGKVSTLINRQGETVL